MSVLQSVKNKLQNVHDDLKASFQSLSLSGNEASKKKLLADLEQSISNINFDAGAELLDKFQSYWAEIHQNSEDNAKRATEVDREVSVLLLFIEKQSLKFQQLSMELGHVQFISQDVQNLHGSLAQLEESFRKLEAGLDELDDLCEEVELQHNCKIHKEQLDSWEEGRAKEMQELKVRMSQEHVKKVQTYEQRKWQNLRLKQEALQEAFMSDMDQYRKLGKIERSQSSCSDGQADIGDIEIDPDNDAELDQFLEVDNTVVATEQRVDNDKESIHIKIIGDEDITSESELAMKYESGAEYNEPPVEARTEAE